MSPRGADGTLREPGRDGRISTLVSGGHGALHAGRSPGEPGGDLNPLLRRRLTFPASCSARRERRQPPGGPRTSILLTQVLVPEGRRPEPRRDAPGTWPLVSASPPASLPPGGRISEKKPSSAVGSSALMALTQLPKLTTDSGRRKPEVGQRSP